MGRDFADHRSFASSLTSNCPDVGPLVVLALRTRTRLQERGSQAGACVVFTASSGTHDPDTMDGKLVGAAVEPDAVLLANDGKEARKPTSAGKRYSTSKLCNVLTAYELHRRLRRSGSAIGSIAFDPGSTAGTGFLRAMPAPVRWVSGSALFARLQKRLGITLGDLGFSGASLARLAADPAFGGASGRYYQSDDGRLVERRSSTLSYDEERARKLWDDSKRLAFLQSVEESTLLR